MYIENYELIVISLILNQRQRVHQFFLLWQQETLLPLSSIYLFEHSLYVISHHYHPLTTAAYTDTLLTLSGPDTSCQVALLHKCSLYPTWTPIPSARVPLPPHTDALITSPHLGSDTTYHDPVIWLCILPCSVSDTCCQTHHPLMCVLTSSRLNSDTSGWPTSLCGEGSKVTVSPWEDKITDGWGEKIKN